MSQGVDDTQVVGVVSTVSKLGIDCALGWPVEFSEFIRAHADPYLATIAPEASRH
jgi:hypothetical protein